MTTTLLLVLLGFAAPVAPVRDPNDCANRCRSEYCAVWQQCDALETNEARMRCKGQALKDERRCVQLCEGVG